VIKRRPQDLAALGGSPAFDRPRHVGAPSLLDRRRLLDRVEEALDRGRLTNHGPLVGELERQIAERVGVRHCIVTSNGTVALELVARATELSGEVLVPALTFVATAHALRWHGLTPVFCDVDPGSHNLDPDRLEDKLTPRTSAIVGVHLWGRPCDVDALSRIATRHHLRLIFDAAHAFGCSYRGRMIGGFGDAEVFSFHATKFVHAFEGGAVVTDDDRLARSVRSMKNFGFAGQDNVVALGINAKMSEISAAMGLTSLETMDRLVEVNRARYERYRRGLQGLPGLSPVPFDSGERCNFQYVLVEVVSERCSVTRDQLLGMLHAEGVLARRYFYPGCHRMEPYRTEQPGCELPETERLVERLLCLPTGPALSERDVDTVCALLRFAVGHGTTLARLLPRQAPAGRRREIA